MLGTRSRFRDHEFDRYQWQMAVQPYADAALRSVPDRERENVIQNGEENPTAAWRARSDARLSNLLSSLTAIRASFRLRSAPTWPARWLRSS